MTRFSAYLATIACQTFAFATPACVAETTTDASENELRESNLAAPATPAGEGLRLSVHTTLGIPESSKSDPDHVLLVKDEFVTSYDTHRKNPRWTSWEVSPEWIGTAERSSSRFRRDAALPAMVEQATGTDFSNSGFQQGHVCPSADRTKSDAVNEATFVFTNVVPQTAASNLGTWKTLENQERALAAEGKHVFVIAGMLYETDRTIGDGVAVPSSMFKVVVAIDGASAGPGDVTTRTRMIAVDVPNTNEVAGNYRNYRTTLADLERRTGLHLLSDVAPDIHDKLAVALNDL